MIRKSPRYLIAFVLTLLFGSGISDKVYGGPAVDLVEAGKNVTIKKGLFYLEDKEGTLGIADVAASGNWKDVTVDIPNFGVTRSTYWVRFTLSNHTDHSQWVLKIAQPILDHITFYDPVAPGSKAFNEYHAGEALPFRYRQFASTDYLFSLNLAPQQTKDLYLRVRNTDNMQIPVIVGTRSHILKADKNKDIFWGIYIGLIASMLLYNLFIYFTVRTSSYFYYVIYLVTVLVTQASIQGYTVYLWPDNEWLNTHTALLSPVLVGLAGVAFMRNFLHTRQSLPKWDKWFNLFIAGYCLAMLLIFLKRYQLAFTTIEICASTVSFYMLFVAYKMSKAGHRQAVFFSIAWSVFLFGILVYTLKDFNVLPYNTFTVYTMPIGSAMEVILLSFALADRINTLKKEKEASQAEALRAAQENERIVTEQNVMLDRKVKERTHELEQSNQDLNQALGDLKEAQAQLVEQEKMASLGQLTAGIAHEINNPINFVTSNVKPLKRDISLLLGFIEDVEKIGLSGTQAEEKEKALKALKEELDYEYLQEEINILLQGIQEGSSRTAEIVKGLRIFSRLDEDDLKKADMNEGLDSTIIIVNNLLNNKIEIVKNYRSLPLIECFPGKLNQVFLNMITNGIHAIKAKFGENSGGRITLSTHADEKQVYVTIADNGIGMDEQTRSKIFEPFFTTKDVGEGTGLGLSIAYNTVKKHNGTILLETKPDEGTAFTLQLPIIHELQMS